MHINQTGITFIYTVCLDDRLNVRRRDMKEQVRHTLSLGMVRLSWCSSVTEKSIHASLVVCLFCVLRLRGKTHPVAIFLLKCLKCCIWCFEKFLKFLNTNAYIEIGKASWLFMWWCFILLKFLNTCSLWSSLLFAFYVTLMFFVLFSFNIFKFSIKSPVDTCIYI